MGFDDDPELSRLLREWHVPDAPDTLAPDLPRPASAWRRLLSSRVRIPLPVAVAVSIVMVWLAILVVRGHASAAVAPANVDDLRGFQPVTSVGVRIERNSHGVR